MVLVNVEQVAVSIDYLLNYLATPPVFAIYKLQVIKNWEWGYSGTSHNGSSHERTTSL